MEEAPLPTGLTPKEEISESFEIKQDNINYKLNIKAINQDIILHLLDEKDMMKEFETKLTLDELKQIHKIFLGINSCKEFVDYIKALIENNKLAIKKIIENKVTIELMVEYLFKQNIIKIDLTTKKINFELIAQDLYKKISILTENFKNLETNYQNIVQENKNIKDENKNIKEENKKIKEELQKFKGENTNIKEELQKMKEENKNIKEENQKMKEESTNIKEKNQKIKEELQKIKEENKNIKEENQIIKEDNNILKRNNIKMEEVNKKYENRINNLEEVVNALNKNLLELKNNTSSIVEKSLLHDYIDSTIIETKRELDMIKSAIEQRMNKEIKTINKIYQATKDGGEPEIYHKKCDNIPNTLTLFKSAGKRRFGGFASECIKSDENPINDKNCFLFSLDKKKIYLPKDNYYRPSCYPNEGPCFVYKGRYCILIDNKSAIINKKLKTCESSHSFRDLFEGDPNALSEDGNFKGIYAEEYEVFQILF